jgi:hypothetical protein
MSHWRGRLRDGCPMPRRACIVRVPAPAFGTYAFEVVATSSMEAAAACLAVTPETAEERVVSITFDGPKGRTVKHRVGDIKEWATGRSLAEVELRRARFR